MMNCRQFQNQMYEYVEGSLSADAQAAAVKHLAGCDACQLAARQEQQRAQFLFDRLRQDTETLALRPEIRRRILASPKEKPIIGLWNRFAWPLGIATALLLVATVLLVSHLSGTRADNPGAPFAVAIEDSYRVPIYKFREEGNLILDTLSYETVAVSETLWIAKPIREKTEKKTPL